MIAIFFSYDQDAEILIEAVESIRDKVDKVIVCEDANALLPTVIKIKLNTKIIQSLPYRGSNLNNVAWASKQVQIMRDEASLLDAEVVLKIDSDIILQHTTRLDNAMKSGKMMAGLNFSGNIISGGCVALKTEAIHKIYDVLKHVEDRDMPEDALITQCVRLIYGNDAIKHLPYDGKGCFMAGYNYEKSMADLKEYAKRFDCVHFGNRSSIVGNSREEKNKVALNAMKEFRRHADI